MRRLVKVFSWWAASWEIQIYPLSNKLSPNRHHSAVGAYSLAMEDRLLRMEKFWKADLGKDPATKSDEFWKSSKGGGSFSIQNIEHEIDKKKSNFRIEGMLFHQLYLY